MRAKDTLGLSQILAHAQHELRLRMDEILALHGLTASQYGVLATLEEFTDGPGLGRTNAELARACFVTPQTMIRLIHGLDDRGFVKSEAEADGLKQRYRLTKKALDILCKAHVDIFKIEKLMVKGLAPKAVRDLVVALKHCFENLKLG